MSKKSISILCVVLVSSLVFSCKQYQYVYDELPNNKINVDQMFLQLKNENDIFLVFTNKFDERISIVENNKIIFDSIISNDSQAHKHAKVLKSKKEFDTYITIDNIRKKIIIEKDSKRNYNVIYIEKLSKDFKIQFSNDIRKI